MSEIDLLPLPSYAQFGRVEYPPGATFGPRRQMLVQFVIVHEGSAKVWLDEEETLEIAAGEVGLLRPGRMERFAFAIERSTIHTWCHLHYPDNAPPSVGKLPDRVKLTPEMDALMQAGVSIGPVGKRCESASVCRLGDAFLSAYEEQAAISNQSHGVPVPIAVSRARRYAEAHLAEPLSLSDLAQAADVTTNHLVRLFNRSLGTTPMRWLWQLRVEQGVHLLHDTGLTISEIAYRLGFADPYHFSHAVRKFRHASPTQLRQSFWKGDRADVNQ